MGCLRSSRTVSAPPRQQTTPEVLLTPVTPVPPRRSKPRFFRVILHGFCGVPTTQDTSCTGTANSSGLECARQILRTHGHHPRPPLWLALFSFRGPVGAVDGVPDAVDRSELHGAGGPKSFGFRGGVRGGVVRGGLGNAQRAALGWHHVSVFFFSFGEEQHMHVTRSGIDDRLLMQEV